MPTAIIPNAIHHLWPITARYEHHRHIDSQQSWKTFHPKWTLQFWTADQAETFIERHFPAFLSNYLAYPYSRLRRDAFRYLLLQHQGGICVDPDIECLHSFDALIHQRCFLIGFEPYAHAKYLQKEYLLSNSLLAAAPGTLFIKRVVETMIKQPEPCAQDSNGAKLLTPVFEQIGDRRISLFPPEVFSPLVANSLAAKEHTRKSAAGRLVGKMLDHQVSHAVQHGPQPLLEWPHGCHFDTSLETVFSDNTHAQSNPWNQHPEAYLFRKNSRADNRKALITVIAWNRPLYLQQVLGSIRQAHHYQDYDIHISVDYHLDTLMETLLVIEDFESKISNKLIIELHQKNIGNTGNTRRSCDYAFVENDYDYMIHLEDDSIMGEDYILWSEWAYEQTWQDKNCFCVCPFIPQDSRIDEGLTSTNPHHSFKRDFFEAQGGFTISNDQYQHILNMGGLFGAWYTDKNIKTLQDWKNAGEINDMLPFDGPMRFYFLADKYTLSPCVSRAQNIGELDGMWNPDKAWHNEHIQNISWIGSAEFDSLDKAQVHYRIVDSGSL